MSGRGGQIKYSAGRGGQGGRGGRGGDRGGDGGRKTTDGRQGRAALAQETLDICNKGYYQLGEEGPRVNLSEDITACIDGTEIYSSNDLPKLARELFDKDLPSSSPSPKVEVMCCTNIECIEELNRQSSGVLEDTTILNFASARNPGGGFLKGSQAHEEALARSSALYLSQTSPRARPYYNDNEADRNNGMYQDSVLWSPLVPFFRDTHGKLLPSPIKVGVITSAAVNAGVVRQKFSHKRGEAEIEKLIGDTMRKRIQHVFAVAASRNVKTLILGAWGCGVFKNDPKVVAKLFAEAIGSGRCTQQRLVFAITDAAICDIFKKELGLTEEEE